MKGQVLEIIIIAGFLLALSVIVIISMALWTPVQTAITSASQDISGGAANAYVTSTLASGEASILAYDFLFIMFAIGAFLATIVTAWYVESHPIFFVASFITWIFVIMLMGVFGNVFFEFQTTADVATAASNYSIMDQFWHVAPRFGMVFGAVLIIITIAVKRRGGSGYYG